MERRAGSKTHKGWETTNSDENTDEALKNDNAFKHSGNKTSK